MIDYADLTRNEGFMTPVLNSIMDEAGDGTIAVGALISCSRGFRYMHPHHLTSEIEAAERLAVVAVLRSVRRAYIRKLDAEPDLSPDLKAYRDRLAASLSFEDKVPPSKMSAEHRAAANRMRQKRWRERDALRKCMWETGEGHLLETPATEAELKRWRSG